MTYHDESDFRTLKDPVKGERGRPFPEVARRAQQLRRRRRFLAAATMVPLVVGGSIAFAVAGSPQRRAIDVRTVDRADTPTTLRAATRRPSTTQAPTTSLATATTTL